MSPRTSGKKDTTDFIMLHIKYRAKCTIRQFGPHLLFFDKVIAKNKPTKNFKTCIKLNVTFIQENLVVAKGALKNSKRPSKGSKIADRVMKGSTLSFWALLSTSAK